MAPRITRDPISPTGTPLWRCTQAERHDWIRQIAPDADPADTEALKTRSAWFRGYEIDHVPGFAPGICSVQHY